ncbi:MAG: GspC family type II secretion system variant ExeC [Nevskia sp.]
MHSMATLSAQNLLSLPRSAPALYARYGRRLPSLASLILVVVIARLLARLVWALIPMPAGAAWQPLPPPIIANRNSGVDLSAITSAGLFGHYAPPTSPVISDLASAPDTQLNLTLLGILADRRNPEASRALIGTQGGDEKPYSIGDDVARGVTLQAIFPDRVILARGGKLETLRLDKDAAGSGSLLPASASGDAQPAESASAAASLAAIRNQLLADPSKVADYIRVQPVNSGNGINGYRIYPGKDRSIFTAAGLRPGDIVTAVNGVQLNDPGKSLQLLSDLSQNNQLNLTVDRGGQPQNFNINLAQ